MWGPCFELIFSFKNKCPLPVFEEALLADSIVSRFSRSIFPSDTSIRYVLRSEHWKTPIGFISYQRDRGDRDDHFFSTYPHQVERQCGQFMWRDLEDLQPENIQSVVQLYVGLIAFVRRLHTRLGFCQAFIHHEDNPLFGDGILEFPGVLIYDSIAEAIHIKSERVVKGYYALIPFE